MIADVLRHLEALVAFEAHLRDVVLPASEGEGRLGRALFAEKIRHTMRSAASMIRSAS